MTEMHDNRHIVDLIYMQMFKFIFIPHDIYYETSCVFYISSLWLIWFEILFITWANMKWANNYMK